MRNALVFGAAVLTAAIAASCEGDRPSGAAVPRSVMPVGVVFKEETTARKGAFGDNWCQTWAADDNVYTMLDDGNGWWGPAVKTKEFPGQPGIRATSASVKSAPPWGGPIFWVATHRIHHQKSDQEGDPHTPREGTWWAHMGWILTGEGLHHDAAVLARYVPDLCRDRVHVALSNWHWVSNVVVGLALLAFGGIPYVLWGIFFRTTVGLHATWLVNSATHLWGSRRFATRDDSTNNWWVALLTFGEGWHNNHHAHPTSARHGLAWYELDLNWLGISALEKVGLAWDVKVAKIRQQPVQVETAIT